MEHVPVLIALFAMVAATSSAIVALINSNTAKNNLREVIDNNRRALRPFLLIRSKEINLDFDANKPEHLLNWDSNTYILSNLSFKSASYIEMASISNGIAKNVSITMIIKNVDFLLKALADSDSDLSINISKGNDKRINVIEKNKKGNIIEYDFEGSPKVFIAVEKGGDYKIPLPPAFIILYNILFLNNSSIEFKELPYLEIIIEHEDIIGNGYKHEYIFAPQSYNLKTKMSQNGSKKSVKAIFDITEKGAKKKESQ